MSSTTFDLISQGFQMDSGRELFVKNEVHVKFEDFYRNLEHQARLLHDVLTSGKKHTVKKLLKKNVFDHNSFLILRENLLNGSRLKYLRTNHFNFNKTSYIAHWFFLINSDDWHCIYFSYSDAAGRHHNGVRHAHWQSSIRGKQLGTWQNFAEKLDSGDSSSNDHVYLKFHCEAKKFPLWLKIPNQKDD